jgi:hypothetical protein
MDPNIRPKIEAARQEAKQNLEKRGIKKGFGYVNTWEARSMPFCGRSIRSSVEAFESCIPESSWTEH